MVILIVTCLPGGLVHAQSGTDVSPAIPVHPDVPTILRLPEKIERAWTHYGDDFRVKGVGDEVYVRPLPGTPAGAEALLEVKTRTLHRIFLLRVVARAEDATPGVTVRAEAATHVEEADRAAAEPTPASLPATAPVPAAAPAPTVPEPPAPEPASATAEARATATAMSPRFDLSLHGFIGFGVAGLDVAGYEPQVGFQPLHAFGLRLAGARPGARWALEASVCGEWPAGPMTFKNSNDSEVDVSGPWLRAEVGTRARLVQNAWIASAYFGVGAQTHLRRIEQRDPFSGRDSLVNEMEHGAIAALGVGLQYRVQKVLLGLDFHVRRGGPTDYHAEVAIWTIGFFPAEENEP